MKEEILEIKLRGYSVNTSLKIEPLVMGFMRAAVNVLVSINEATVMGVYAILKLYWKRRMASAEFARRKSPSSVN